MKKITNWVFSVVMLFVVNTVFAQGKVSGTVVDSELNTPLSGVNVKVKGTSTGVATDANGKFSLTTTATSGQLVISFIGYENKTVSFNGKDLGTIKLSAASNQLEEVVIKSTVIDVAKDRKTPVAVSTIKAAEIVEKLGNQEFPEILKTTPSVYATKSGGGFGDSRVVIRGFDQKNVAVMINGVPVNDMENSSVYWSNWAGLSDVTSAMQVQRGLGSSKIVNAAVGGNINVVTKTSDMKEGGIVSATIANDNYFKTNVAYNTGKMKNGLSASILLSQTNGNEYANGTHFEAANYFIALGYDINSKNNIQFTFTGAPQWHNQRGTVPTIAQYLQYGSDGEPNRKLNLDAGQFNGSEFSMRTNYYHKPVASLNWDYKISEKTKFSTVLYGSWGRGGGTSGSGGAKGNSYTSGTVFKNADGSLNVDKIFAWNTGQTIDINGTPTTRTLTNGEYINSSTSSATSDGISKIASTNSHNWYGGVASLNTKLTNELTLDFGLDVRTYKGIHFQTVNDLIGAFGYKDALTATNGDINNPNQVIRNTYEDKPNLNPFWNTDYQQKVNYYNDSKVNWLGAFSQLEYSKNNLTAFIQGAFSQQGYKRIDHFRYTEASGDQETSFKNILGGNAKAGINYNLTKNHNVFVNSGYYSKQPFMNAVYPNNKNVVYDDLSNEKIFGVEVGYGFRSSRFNANVNFYRTTWKNRTQVSSETSGANSGGYFFYTGINETHQGVEVDFNYKPLDKLVINGMFSVGDWFYNGTGTSSRFTATNAPYGTTPVTTLYLDKVKVGNAAQTTASLGVTYEVVKRVKLDANYNFAQRLYASFDPTKFTSENNKGVLQLPDYGLVDTGFSYKMLVGKDKSNSVNFRINVNNLFDRIYIAETSGVNSNIFADDIKSGTQTYEQAGAIYKGIATANQVFFGFGRTWNFGITYKF
ncbi:TonB-dependent receptor [Flavobacterium croceum]|uniref:TonB-dependent receptor n=1 Tax=Flavobacterium croceum TaxID=370975 RepID=UPI0024A8DD2F|nr:TonB-dependent receptor [Flavobacterium croceum]